MNRHKFFSLGTLILLCSIAAHAESSSTKEIVRAMGVKGGLVVHVGCGDGKLTAELRVNDRYVVQGLDSDTTSVKKARQHIKSLGVYGKVTADSFDGEHLPYADNLINLLIVEDSVNLATDEIMRVLAPRGVVHIKKDGIWQKRVKAWPDDIDE